MTQAKYQESMVNMLLQLVLNHVLDSAFLYLVPIFCIAHSYMSNIFSQPMTDDIPSNSAAHK